MLLKVPNDYKYERVRLGVHDRERVFFAVKACKNVFLALEERPNINNVNTYEIAIGIDDNSRTAIRVKVKGPNKKGARTPSVLNCGSSVTFWVSWTGGNVRIGKGDVYGQNELVSWQDPVPHAVNSLALSSSDPAGPVEFTFVDVPGKACHGFKVHFL